MALESGWTLTGGAFDRLLDVLGDDREAAAEAYGQLRTRVTGLLRWWGAADPETLADVALDRAARKLQEGTSIERGDFGAYVRGVARMVYLEAARKPKYQPLTSEPMAEPVAEPNAALDCLDHCLSSLSPDDRRLVLRYYDGTNQIANRREIAKEMGVSSTALRLRTHRLRGRLEACVSACVKRK